MHLKPNHPSVAAAGRTLIGFNIVHGREVEGDLGLIESRSAVDSRDVVGLFPDSGAKDVERAAKAAADAFAGWSRTTSKTRIKLLERLAPILEAQQARLARIVTRETGLTPREALAEVRQTIDACQELAALGSKPFTAKPSGSGRQVLRRPLGVVGILSSQTSPLALPARKLLTALHLGNTVVWKPSDGAPSTAYLLLRALQEAGLPAGVVNTVNGKGRGGCGKHFLGGIEKGCFQLFCFAGSIDLGRSIGELCGRHLVPADLETGGRNALVVLEDADLEAAVAVALADAFTCAGQRSAALGNILLQRSVAAEFTERFLAGAAALRTGNPLSHPEVDYGPLLNHRFAEAFRNHWEKGRQEGATLRFGGQQWTEENRTVQVLGEIPKGAYMQPCVWTGVTPGMALFQHEVYGPTVNLVEVDGFEAALALVNQAPRGRAAALFSADRRLAQTFKSEARTASISINAALDTAGPLALETWTRPHGIVDDGPPAAATAPEPAASLPAPVDWAALDP